MSPSTEAKTLGFIFGSGLLHVTTVAAISMMNMQPQKPKLEMIEFEVTASQGVQTENPAAPPAPALAESVAEAPTKTVVPQPEPTKSQVLPEKTAVVEPVQEVASEPIQEIESEPAVEVTEVSEITESVDAKPTPIESAPLVEAPAAVETTETGAATEAVTATEAAVPTETETVQTTATAIPVESEAAPVGSDVAAANGTQAEAKGAVVGIADGVRQLEQLKQKPGNRKPSYDKEDRLRGRQGKVSLLAYISRDGRPVQFKMLQSSGYRSLDLKTLAAVRSWQFYPGQEGWVEIPIQWDLRGGPQEAPATLRRQGIIN